MSPFDFDYEQSLALHEAVAQKLHEDPGLVRRAQAKLEEWLSRGGRSSPLWLRWQELLQRPTAEVEAFLVERTDEAAWLRKASPFAGVLSPRERLAIMRRMRQRFASTT